MDYLALCMIVKDEDEDYLHEWVDFHTLIGVERFFIYDNESAVPVRRVLREDIERGRVVVTEFPGKSIQLTAYGHCLRYYGAQARWMGFIDADEFLIPKTTSDMREFLIPYEPYGGLLAYWTVMGSSGHLTKPAGLQLTYFTAANPPDFTPNNLYKSIVQTQYAIFPETPHHFFYRPGAMAVNENFEPFGEILPPRSVEKIQLNHYYTRSREQYHRKVERGRADGGENRPNSEFIYYDRSAVIEDLHAVNLLERLLDGKAAMDLAAAAAVYPSPRMFISPVIVAPGRSLQQEELETLLDLAFLARKRNDDYALSTICFIIRWRFDATIWKIPAFRKDYLHVCEFFMDLGNYPQAKEWLDEAIQALPQSSSFLKRRGMCSFLLGEISGAERDFKEALTYTPQDADLLVSLGKVYFHTGRSAEALRYLQGALAIHPQNEEARIGVDAILERSTIRSSPE